jgi:hypothetical protein
MLCQFPRGGKDIGNRGYIPWSSSLFVHQWLETRRPRMQRKDGLSMWLRARQAAACRRLAHLG